MKSNALPFLATGLAIVLCSFGCASFESRTLDPSYRAHGPGSHFTTLEAAVVDALAYSHLEGQRTGTHDRIRGGVISRSGDGFTYSRVEIADVERPERIEYSLGTHDVARFHVYPIAPHPAENRKNESPTAADRRSVDRGDPLHRPLYVLTPKLSVKAYYGQGESVETVANLREIETEQILAGSPQ